MSAKGKKYLAIFAGEAGEHVAALRQGILALEEGGGAQERLHALLRSAHTLKGAARMLDLGAVARLTHALEDHLKDLEAGIRPCSPETIDLLLLATDALEAQIAQATRNRPARFDLEAVIGGLHAGEMPAAARLPTAGEDSAGPEPPPSVVSDSVRVEVGRLDQMVNLIGESGLVARHLQEREGQLVALERELDGFLGGLRREENHRRLAAILAQVQQFRVRLQKDLLEFHLLNELLAEEAEGLRMVPLALLVGDLRRVVRDLARDEDKEVRFSVQGEDVAFDRMLWESLRPALIHLLRNAVDHGIEKPEARRTAGKAPGGEISLKASHERSGVCITLRDDGCGIDADLVRRLALEKGLIDPAGAEALTDEEALYLILRPGFSTRRIITDLSGRGIGMDVVRTSMERIKGNLVIRSRPGAGTEIELHLPLTLARMNGLVVSCEGERYALPLQYVVGVVHLREEDILTQGGREMVRYEEQTRPLNLLREALGLAPRELIGRTRVPAVVLRCGEQIALWAVSRIEQVQELRVKGLGPQLRSLAGFSGAALLADGLPALILSVPELFARSRGGARRPAPRAARRPGKTAARCGAGGGRFGDHPHHGAQHPREPGLRGGGGGFRRRGLARPGRAFLRPGGDRYRDAGHRRLRVDPADARERGPQRNSGDHRHLPGERRGQAARHRGRRPGLHRQGELRPG